MHIDFICEINNTGKATPFFWKTQTRLLCYVWSKCTALVQGPEVQQGLCAPHCLQQDLETKCLWVEEDEAHPQLTPSAIQRGQTPCLAGCRMSGQLLSLQWNTCGLSGHSLSEQGKSAPRFSPIISESLHCKGNKLPCSTFPQASMKSLLCSTAVRQWTWYRNIILVKSVVPHQQHNWIWLLPGVSQLLSIILPLSLTHTRWHTTLAKCSCGALQMQKAQQVWKSSPQTSPVLAHSQMAALRAYHVLHLHLASSHNHTFKQRENTCSREQINWHLTMCIKSEWNWKGHLDLKWNFTLLQRKKLSTNRTLPSVIENVSTSRGIWRSRLFALQHESNEKHI